MSAQDLILGARVAHLKELKTEISRLKAENSELRAENDALLAHFDLALLVAQDLNAETTLELWDGWNLILGAQRVAKDRDELLVAARTRLAEDPSCRIWIIFDGHDERVALSEPRLRVSYTGGTGPHRADRFILDFARMAAYRGLIDRLLVKTTDKDILKRFRALDSVRTRAR